MTKVLVLILWMRYGVGGIDMMGRPVLRLASLLWRELKSLRNESAEESNTKFSPVHILSIIQVSNAVILLQHFWGLRGFFNSIWGCYVSPPNIFRTTVMLSGGGLVFHWHSLSFDYDSLMECWADQTIWSVKDLKNESWCWMFVRRKNPKWTRKSL